MQVALYARVSSGSEEQANALEQQKDRLTRKAAELNPGVEPLWYVDIASGSKDDRPELAKLLADCSRGRISSVVVTRLDRLSRSSSHGAQLLRFFQQESTPNLIALDDSLDLSNAGGRFMARMLVSWAEAESDRLSERVRRGAAYRRSKLAPLGRRAPFGYRFTDDRLSIEPHPKEWPVAQALVAHFLKHRNLTQTLRLSIDTYEVSWGSNYSLRRWLSNPALTGARVYGGGSVTTDPETGKKVRRTNPPGVYREVHPDCHPALLSIEQHALILSIFEANAKAERRQLLPGRVRVLTGLVLCQSCGRNLVSRTVLTKVPYIQLRCQTPDCAQGTRNAIKESAALRVVAQSMGVYAQQLASRWDLERATLQTGLSPEAQALAEQIRRLEAENDPELAAALQAKRERLKLLSTKPEHSGVMSFLSMSDRIAEPAFWTELLAHNPETFRVLLQESVRLVADEGRITALRFAPSLRLPGDDGLLLARA